GVWVRGGVERRSACLFVLMAQVSGSRACRSRPAASVRRSGGWGSGRDLAHGAGGDPRSRGQSALDARVSLAAGPAALQAGTRRARGGGAGAPGKASAAGDRGRWVRWGGSVGVRQVGESSGPGDTGSARAITRNSERGTRNSCSRSAVQQLFRLRHNVLDRQPQLLIDPLVRRGCPEPLDTEHDAAVTY